MVSFEPLNTLIYDIKKKMQKKITYLKLKLNIFLIV